MEYMESKMQDHLEAGVSENDRLRQELAQLRELCAELAAQLKCRVDREHYPTKLRDQGIAILAKFEQLKQEGKL